MTEGQSNASTFEAESLICPACGYDLRAIASDKCPECGLAIDRTETSVSRIPWEHREGIGRFTAFWRTTGLVLFHPKKLAEEVNRPVTYHSARRFQLVAVTIAWASLCPWLLADNLRYLKAPFGEYASVGRWMELVIFVVALASVGLFFYMASGVGSYWYHPRGMPVVRQNRAVALSYYASAPLGWLWLPSVLFLFVYMLQDAGRFAEQLGLVIAIVAGLLTAGLLFDGYVVTVNLMRNVTHCGSRRSALMAVLLPMMWGVCFCLAAALPLAVIYVSLMILSFH